MAIGPRFRRVAALQRPFVDRESLLAAFAAERARVGTGPRILNVTGVGGIGKSRLLRHLADSVGSDWRTATIDLQVPALRQPEDALAVLRGQFGAQGVRFDRFDIAYAVLWQRLHPHLRLTRTDLPFVEASSILTDIVDSVSGVPVFGTAIGLLKLLDKAASGTRERRRIRHDATLDALDGLPNSELGDAVTFLFAQDLRVAAQGRPYAVLVDTYEALVPSPARGGRTQLADWWLRDLIGQLDRGLVVVGSREPLRWEAHDPEWASVIRVCDLGGLPMASRLELLSAGGIDDRADQQTIARASAGLPFYLNLAVDTYQQTGRHSTDLVSREEILARFLDHVAADEIATLEILSPARLFDYGIFRELAAVFHLPAYRVAWDSLTAYSFIYPAASGVRFHQLMGEALQRRLTAAGGADIHAVLGGIWDRRADAALLARADPGIGARALREAAFHRLRAGPMAGAELLDYADRALNAGGNSAANGIADDLDAFLVGQPAARRAELEQALGTLRAEAAVRLGDAAAAVALTEPSAGTGASTLTGVVAGRLAVAAGHGRRIAGDTTAALEIYARVWGSGTGAAQLAAGLWAADLHMCQGRFREAETLAAQIDVRAPDGADELRGDVARLRSLACRFGFDFAAAGRHLDEAAAHYTVADSVIGLANIATNRAELLAITDPAAALGEARRAIEVQREVGAHHELGKAYTALAMAQIRLHQLTEATTTLRSAFDELDRAGYRSGRARAEIYQALVFARLGFLDDAQVTLGHAVAELEAADVYPTLILCADRALEILGLDRRAVEPAANRARRALQPLTSTDDLASRIDAYVTELLADAWHPADLFREAAGRADAESGFYHHNLRVDPPSGPVIVRIPIPASDAMDLTIWPEPAVLRALRGHVRHAPALLYAQEHPRYQIHGYLPGALLDDVAPRGVAVPGHVIDDILALFGELGRVPRSRIPAPPAGWPADGDPVGFARRLAAVTIDVHRRFAPEFGALFTSLKMPADPFARIDAGWAGLHSRPFRLLHTDIHRKNMIVADGGTYFLDWELALYGDPVYDLAVHLHKMAYRPDETDRLLAGWERVVTGPAADHWRSDLAVYLAHERVKSAIVDTVRYTKLLSQGTLDDQQRGDLIRKLVDKLNAAYDVWRVRHVAEPAAVSAVVSRRR